MCEDAPLAAVETDAHALQAAAVLLRQALKLALRILAVVVPRRPGADDIDLGREIGIGDILPIDVGGAELGELGTGLEMGEALELHGTGTLGILSPYPL